MTKTLGSTARVGLLLPPTQLEFSRVGYVKKDKTGGKNGLWVSGSQWLAAERLRLSLEGCMVIYSMQHSIVRTRVHSKVHSKVLRRLAQHFLA